MAKIIFISDTHNKHDGLLVPDGDILIHCGDATMRGTIEEIVRFNVWFSQLPHKHKVFCAGNHDWLFESNPTLAQSLLDKSINYLQDSEVSIAGLRIYGSPWQPRFFEWAFNLDRGASIKRVWDKIPPEVDILVTHGPPFGILDVIRDEHAGCEMLIEAVGRVKPRVHAFGHIHEGYGVAVINGVTYINASVLDGDYRLVNAPIEIVT